MELVQIPELLATACWFIWWQRRQLVRGEPVQNSEQTALSLHALTLNFVKARGKVAQPQRINKWRPSLEGQLILNVDVSFSELDYTGASGTIIRDNRGRFIKAAIARLYHVPDVVLAEAVALLEGLKLLQSTGCNNDVIRMDSLTMVEALQNNEGHSMVVAPILEDCRDILRDIGKAVVEHCFRDLNVVAHELARWGSSNNPEIWLDIPPDFILRPLAEDVTLV
ncbi:unnamed protein product [Triticum aestivum]|uniref:RNase H type-1 domain-containing protein n=1 Tax=Triticum aestivum TaxID=4565 RepID=A0A7H4LNQ9_WHEAT|nr:unnamed protein product [Triticum aestivum]